jgi:drug/metabolite transporter superfamily protein YnfA
MLREQFVTFGGISAMLGGVLIVLCLRMELRRDRKQTDQYER